VKVLVVAADVPWPTDGGGKIASLNVLRALARHHTVDLLALADPAGPQSLDPLRELTNRLQTVPHAFTYSRHKRRQLITAARSVVSTSPYRQRKFRNAQFAEVLNQWKTRERYDVVHYDQFGALGYRDPRLPATALVHNVEHDMYRLASRTSSGLSRAWARLEYPKLERFEARALAEFDHLFTLSTHDRDLLGAIGVNRVTTLTMPAPQPLPAREPVAAPTLLSLGSMSWFGVEDGLMWFYDQVLPVVRQSMPGVRWHLVGSGATRRIRELAATDSAVVVHGYVDDIAPLIERSRVAIVPLRFAGGIRMKLLDLFAWGLPAVATSVGAQGMDFADGEGCFRRDDPTAFAGKVVELLRSDAAWSATAEGGRSYLQRRNSGRSLDDELSAGLDDAVRQRRVAA
jgi:glycosyltransferase involved in cell wall biosynthesis